MKKLRTSESNSRCEYSKLLLRIVKSPSGNVPKGLAICDIRLILTLVFFRSGAGMNKMNGRADHINMNAADHKT